MNWILTIIIGGICLGIGWLIGHGQANDRLENIEKAIEYTEETSNLISSNRLLALKAQEQILLLQMIQEKNYESAQSNLIENLKLYYQGVKESVHDDMAEEIEIEILNQLKLLAEDNSLFAQIIE